MNNMNFCHALKTNGVQTELQTEIQTDRVSCRGASLLKIKDYLLLFYTFMAMIQF